MSESTVKNNVNPRPNPVIEKITTAFKTEFEKELYNTVKTETHVNARKIRNGQFSVTFNVTPEDNDLDKNFEVSLYIVKHSKVTQVLAVNNLTHAIVFSNIGADAIDKVISYVLKYVERTVKKMLGIDIDENEFRIKKVSKSKYSGKKNGKNSSFHLDVPDNVKEAFKNETDD